MAAPYSIWSGDALDGTFIEDYSPMVFAPPIQGADISLWKIVPKQADGEDPEAFRWVNEEVVPLGVSITSGIDDNDTALTCSAAAVVKAGIRANCIIRPIGGEELLFVTDVSGGTLTVSRGYGDTDAASYNAGQEFELVSALNYEGEPFDPTDQSFARRGRDTDYNHYSILDRWTRISVEDMKRRYRGSTPDNWVYQLEGVRQQFERIFERALFHSPRVAPDPPNFPGSMGGIMWWVRNAGGDNIDDTAATFSYEVIDEAISWLYSTGTLEGNDVVCIMPPIGIRAAAYIHQEQQTMEYLGETGRGLQCNYIVSSLTGQRVPLIPSAQMRNDSFLLLNMRAVKVHFLSGLALALFTAPFGTHLQSYQAGRLYSNITLEFQRPGENAFLRKGLTYSLGS